MMVTPSCGEHDLDSHSILHVLNAERMKERKASMNFELLFFLNTKTDLQPITSLSRLEDNVIRRISKCANSII